GRGRDLGVHLVGGDLQQRLVLLHLVADVLEPAGDRAFGDALTQRRQRDLRASLAGRGSLAYRLASLGGHRVLGGRCRGASRRRGGGLRPGGFRRGVLGRRLRRGGLLRSRGFLRGRGSGAVAVDERQVGP